MGMESTLVDMVDAVEDTLVEAGAFDDRNVDEELSILVRLAADSEFDDELLALAAIASLNSD